MYDNGSLHPMERECIAVIGGGPAGLMAAAVLAPHCDVAVYDQGKSVGRKFLVAGQGGFNITTSMVDEALRAKYTPSGFLDEALAGFGPTELRAWLAEIGIGTYVGSSGRVFPTKGIKPIEVLNAIRQRLIDRGVRFHLEHAFTGFDDRAMPVITHAGQRIDIKATRVLFALGGASWPITGSTGTWPALFEKIGVETLPFKSSNAGIHIPWPVEFATAHAGKALKNIRVSVGDLSALGEATITSHGLEGNAIYPLIPAIREALSSSGSATLVLDLKPNNVEDQLKQKVAGRAPSEYPSLLNLDRAQVALIKAFTTKEDYHIPVRMVAQVKALHLPVTGLRPLEEAISTVGGIPTSALTPTFAIKQYPHVQTIGEMVDWDAPTGGFLLQGCFAMGHHAAQCILRGTH